MPTSPRDLAASAARRGPSSSVRALDDPTGPPLLRDLRRLFRLAQVAWIYWTAGSRVRRAYRQAQKEGTTLWLDEEP
jgi:hypothetical protein